MARIRHLSKAPITEAIVDIRVKARKDIHASQFAQLKDQLAGELPEVIEQRGIQASFTFDPDKGPEPTTQDLGPRGYFFKSSDGLNIAQFRVDGFTYNRLKPYTSWNEIFPAALRLWHLYVTIAAPTHATRLALRYINQISVSPAVRGFEDILTAPPTLPPGLPHHLSRFLARVTLHDPATDLTAHVSQAFEPKEEGQNGTVTLDIDAFYQSDLALEDTRTLDEISRVFGELHSLKNRIFFESLTERTITALQ